MSDSGRQVRLSLPASAGEFGPGLASFGMALSLRNHYSFGMESDLEEPRIICTGEYGAEIPDDADNLAYRAFRYGFRKVSGCDPEGVSINCEANIPVNKGLGSSATAVLAGLYAGSAMAGGTLEQRELMIVAAELDGGYSSVVPSLIGGFTVSSPEDMRFVQLPVLPGVEVLTVVPEIDTDCNKFRHLSDNSVSLKTARVNIARSSLISTALLTSDAELFFKCLEDEILQPGKRRMITGLQEVQLALRSSKVSGAGISGCSLLIFLGDHEKPGIIQRKVEGIFRRKGVATRCFRLLPSDTGLREE